MLGVVPGYRLMWLMVTFDLPVETKENKRDYRRFVDFLEDNGFARIQYSIYVRPTTTLDHTEVQSQRIADHLPPAGQVRVFRMTDKQWARTDCYHNGSPGSAETPPEQLLFFDEEFEPVIFESISADIPPEIKVTGAFVAEEPRAKQYLVERPAPAVGKRKSRLRKPVKPRQASLEI